MVYWKIKKGADREFFQLMEEHTYEENSCGGKTTKRWFESVEESRLDGDLLKLSIDIDEQKKRAEMTVFRASRPCDKQRWDSYRIDLCKWKITIKHGHNSTEEFGAEDPEFHLYIDICAVNVQIFQHDILVCDKVHEGYGYYDSSLMDESSEIFGTWKSFEEENAKREKEIKEQELASRFNPEWFQIQDRLTKWREERQLTVKGQEEGLTANILEEYVEYLRAKNDMERIDAICDIIVFLSNAFPELARKCGSNFVRLEKTPNKDVFEKAVLKCAETNSVLHVEDLLINSLKLLQGFGVINGFLDETLKEIESRTGHFDPEINKFVKSPGAYDKKEAMEAFLKTKDLPKFGKYDVVEGEDTWDIYKVKRNSLQKYIVSYVKWYKADYAKYMGRVE